MSSLADPQDLHPDVADEPEDARLEDAPAEPAEPVPRFYRHVDLGAHLDPGAFLPLEKRGAVYAAPLAEPLLVQTPPLTLASDLVDEEGVPAGHAYVLLPRAFLKFAREAEARVVDACVANKAEWFRRRPVTDDALRAGFKEFCKASGHLKVKVPEDALVFDHEGALLDRQAYVRAGQSVRALLQLDRVCFGRTEFGAMWSLVQAQLAPPAPPPPRCLIDPAAEGCDEPPGAGPEEAEFL